ncbi:HD domain-containing protein [Virgibacillus flavescens]|uniref:HD domain-containing protein n=1 Tax=Virgibacillus flavescens TaxID=1611422 RepID=UPI003D332142
MDNKTIQLDSIRDYIFNLFQDDATGHDFYHMERVARLAKTIARNEAADAFITEAAAWLHDVGDKKLFVNPQLARIEMDEFLDEINVTKHEVKAIQSAMESVSFSKGLTPSTLEGKIVQDADRLDAIGAIGIARVFAYGGTKDQHIYDGTNPNNTSIQHFYDKLIKLKGMMHTQTAIDMAKERHQFMETYLDHFFQEWKGES